MAIIIPTSNRYKEAFRAQFQNHSLRQQNKGWKGATTEYKVIHAIRDYVSDEWVLLNNVIIPTKTGRYAQFDHLLLSAKGAIVIETKGWKGEFRAQNNKWKRKDGKKWVACSSPTIQNQRHVSMFERVLKDENIALRLASLVIFCKSKEVSVQRCYGDVAKGTKEALQIIQAYDQSWTPMISHDTFKRLVRVFTDE